MQFIPGGNRDRPGWAASRLAIMTESSHRRTEKKENRPSDIFEDMLPMINAACFFFLSRLSCGPCERKTQDTWHSNCVRLEWCLKMAGAWLIELELKILLLAEPKVGCRILPFWTLLLAWTVTWASRPKITVINIAMKTLHVTIVP